MSSLSAANRPLDVRARGDWQVVRVEFSGQPAFVATDPVTLASVHLSAEEHFLWERLRTATSLAELRRAFEQRFAPRRVTESQLQQFMTTLHQQGLVISDRPGQGAELHRRDARRRHSQRWQRLLQVFAIRLGAIRGGPLVDGLYGLLRPAFSCAGVAAAALLLLAATTLLITRGGEMASRMPALADLMAPRRWPLWVATLAGVKVLHELGHALALRHFGGRCREIGVLLLAGMPSLYCDASDAWRLPAKSQRMAVSAAGMAVELLLAAAALLTWHATPPGLLNALALSTALVCSFHTLLVNGNPLLRYDGYYLLADWLEVPNLAQRSRGLIRGAARRWLLAEPGVGEPLLPPGKRRLLVGFAVASVAYGILVLALIVAMLLRLAAPFRAEAFVYLAAALAALGLVLTPMRAAVRIVQNPREHSRLRWLRLAVAMLTAGGCAYGIWMWPIVRQVEAPAVLAGVDDRPVFITTAGRLQAHATAGAEVAAGDLLATLENPELEQAILQQQGEVDVARVRVEQLRIMRAAGQTTGAALPTALAELAAGEARLAELLREGDQLEIRAPAAGRILPPPSRDRDVDGERLPLWSGQPLEMRNDGAWIEPGVALAAISPPGEQLVWAALDDADVSAVAAGQPVRVLFDQAPWQPVDGQVRRVTRRVRNANAKQEFHVAEQRLQRGMIVHVAEIALINLPETLLPSARATVKIETQRTTAGWLIRRKLGEHFRLPW